MQNRTIRVIFLVMILLSGASLAQSALATASIGGSESPDSESTSSDHWDDIAEQPASDQSSVVPDRENVTVFTGYKDPLVALYPNGTIKHYNDSRKSYWDVDPAVEGDQTVVYAATEDLNSSECGSANRCKLNVIERANLTTGETSVLYSRVRTGTHNNEWHDIDQINETHFLVVDMVKEMVYIVDVRSGLIDWAWDAQNAVSITEEGSKSAGTSGYPNDWTHMNDVEQLDDGRIMVSLRNQDKVVFINKTSGIQREWTLGENDDTRILYEQHNPDYIPSEDGGPALLVADSENNRIIEYQRQGEDWNQSWVWSDTRLHWPRDADRLPNGNTLISDVHGNRLLEVDIDGNVVWEANLPNKFTIYDAERLGTGDESEGGESAAHLEGKSTQVVDSDSDTSTETPTSSQSPSISEWIYGFVKGLLPTKLINGALFIFPWLTPGDFLPMAILIGSSFTWIVAEVAYLENSYIQFRSPIHRK